MAVVTKVVMVLSAIGAVVDSHAEAHRDAGLRLVNLWRSIEEPTNIFFVLEIDDLNMAREFINSPGSARAGEEAGAS